MPAVNLDLSEETTDFLCEHKLKLVDTQGSTVDTLDANGKQQLLMRAQKVKCN
jgi:hypothetical protein